MRNLIHILTVTLLISCSSDQKTTQSDTIYVSILPLRSLVEQIVGDDFDIEVLVPAGASPETFEPTARQMVELDRAQMVFNVGLIDFEKALLKKLPRQDKVIDLSRGVELIAGECSHSAHSKHLHTHGVDPHIWTSPRALRLMANNAYEAIRMRYPDSVKYAANHARLQQALEELDRRTALRLARSGATRFLIYHPALAYYARDYGLRQIAIEADGKEPSAKRIGDLIREARADSITKILYQREFPESVVATVARDMGARAVRIDPLAEDFIATIDSITLLIASK